MRELGFCKQVLLLQSQSCQSLDLFGRPHGGSVWNVLSRVFRMSDEICIFKPTSSWSWLASATCSWNSMSRICRHRAQTHISHIWQAESHRSSENSGSGSSKWRMEIWTDLRIWNCSPADFSSSEEERLIDLTSDSTKRQQFKSKTLAAFWIEIEKYCPLLGETTLVIVLPFAASYQCEIDLLSTQTTDQSYTVRKKLRVTVSKLQPRFWEDSAATGRFTAVTEKTSGLKVVFLHNRHLFYLFFCSQELFILRELC